MGYTGGLSREGTLTSARTGCWTRAMRPLLYIMLLAIPLAASTPARAEAPLTASQAQNILSVLRDDTRRTAFEATLDAIARALPDTAAPAPALEPRSLAMQLLSQAAATVADAGHRARKTLQSVNDLPLLWRWLAAQATDAEARDRIADALWRVALVLAAAAGTEWAGRWMLRGVRARAGAWSPAPDTEADVAPGPVARASFRRRGLNRALGAMRRAPYVLVRLLLDVLPTLGFALVAFVLMREWLAPLTEPATPGPADHVAHIVTEAYVVGRVMLALVAIIAAPDRHLRLLDIPDAAARFLVRWAWRLVLIAGTGWVLAETGLVFGMYQTAHDALLKLFALAVHGCAIAMVLQARGPVSARIRSGGTGHPGLASTTRALVAQTWHIVAILYLIALWVVWVIELRDGYQRLLYIFAVTGAVIAVARLLAVLALGLLDRLRPDTTAEAGAGRVAFYVPMLRVVIAAAITGAAAVVLLQAWGTGAWAWLLATGLGARFAGAGLTIAVTVLLAVLAWEAVNAVAVRNLDRMTAAGQLARAGRLRTLLPLLRTTLLVVLLVIVALMVLSEIGINIAPLLAGAGVVGIAVGFGSQKLVQDLITGLFLLLENAMQVGDVVTLGGLSGTVEALSIRTIRLRALDGSVHIIPFSAVTTVTNQTRDYGYAVVDLSIGLSEEPDGVTAIVREVAAAMRAEPRWASIVLDALEVMGVERFVDMAYVLRVRLKTQPASRWSVGRELNRRVKVRFDELAIESPMTSYKALSMAGAPAASQQETG